MKSILNNKERPVRAKKSLGQHFLTCAWVLDALIKGAELIADDTVLEIGPGTGILTEALARHSKKIIAVEKDEALAAQLGERLKEKNILNVEVITGDILEILPSLFSTYNLQTNSYKLISNLPYYLTARLMRTLFEQDSLPSTIVVTVQREVAERIVARPPKMSLLSLSIQVFGKTEILRRIPRSCFSPPPRVESAILKVSSISRDFFDSRRITPEDFFRVLRSAFANKRKVLTTTLAPFVEKADLRVYLRKNGLSEKARPGELAPQQWAVLLREVERKREEGN